MSDLRHVSADDLVLYVLGALEGGRQGAVEAHVMACEACAGRLAHEAQFETALEEVALRSMASIASDGAREHANAVRLATASAPDMSNVVARSPRRAMRSGRFMGGALGALAAAAGIVLMFSQTSHADTVSASQMHTGAFDGAPGMMGDISGAVSFEGRSDKADNLDGG